MDFSQLANEKETSRREIKSKRERNDRTIRTDILNNLDSNSRRILSESRNGFT